MVRGCSGNESEVGKFSNLEPVCLFFFSKITHLIFVFNAHLADFSLSICIME